MRCYCFSFSTFFMQNVYRRITMSLYYHTQGTWALKNKYSLGKKSLSVCARLSENSKIEIKTRAQLNVIYKAEKWSTHVQRTKLKITGEWVLSISSPKVSPLYYEKALSPHWPHTPFLHSCSPPAPTPGLGWLLDWTVWLLEGIWLACSQV